MKISLVTATFNSGDTIADTLESIQNQSYHGIEHIIIDGASQDNTLEIVKTYPHVAKLISDPDNGIYDAMNKGIGLADGQIIGILNSDDFYTYTDAIQDVAELFITQNVDCVYADLNYIDTKVKNKIRRKWKSGIYHDEAFRKGWMPPHPTFFVKKEVYDKYGYFNLDMGTAADYELMLRFLVKHKCSVAYLPKTIINMRTGGASNISIKARIKANRMDRKAWEINNLEPGVFTFILKPLRKILQFF